MAAIVEILTTPTFDRVVKKLHAKDKQSLDKAILRLVADPKLGQEKKGDLAEVFVYKFKINKQEILLAYRLEPSKTKPRHLVLLALGSHENFYASLKR